MSSPRNDPRRALLGFTALALAPLFILVDSAIGLGRGWRMTYGQEKAILAASLILLVGAGLLFALPRGRKVLARRWPHLTSLLFAALLGVFLLEVAARNMPAEEAAFHLRQASRQWVFRPNPQAFPGLSPESRYTTNMEGVRGPEMPQRDDAARILCLGGSTTECLYLDDAKTWTHLLMQEMNAHGSAKRVWIGSAGASGYASDAHAAFVKVSPLMDQIDVLVVMAGVNDLAKSLTHEGSSVAAGGEVRRPELIGRPLWRRSRALIEAGVLVKRVRQRLTQGSIAYEDVDGKSYVERRLRRRNASQSDDTTGLLEGNPVFDQYAQYIRTIIAACRRDKIRPVFVAQPVLWTKSMSKEANEMLWFGWREDGSYLSVSSLRGLMDRYNAVLRGTCAAEGVECIDLSSMDGRVEWFYDDCHFNEAGAREVARLISERLR